MKKGHKKFFSFSTRLPGASQKNRTIEQDCKKRHGIRPARLPTTLTQSGGVRGAFTGQFPRSLVSAAPCCKIKIKSLTFFIFLLKRETPHAGATWRRPHAMKTHKFWAR